ncbi:MAG: type II toxin-antitoxin system VapC family toxin [Campylobacterota bacterium]|nr:type II toxin-antitoxin system VapC family toxin [Campylobacterota bacterium]
MECKKVFLDSNIVLDILNSSRSQSEEAKLLWKELVVNDIDIVISEDMLSTVFYINKNKKTTLEFFNVIRRRWIISSFGEKLIEDAIAISLEKNLDLEDVLQCLCAKNNKCDILITNDKKFYDCGVKIMSIKEFLDEK